MENITSFYYEARYDLQDTHFPEDIPEELWELWYRQATADDGQLHHKDMPRALKKKLLSAPLERLQRLFRLRSLSAKSES